MSSGQEKGGCVSGCAQGCGEPGDRESRWIQAWEKGKTGWDLAGPTPALVQLLARPPDSVELPGSGLGLVPGAGSGYDVLALARAVPGVQMLGLDLSPVAAERFAQLLAGDSGEGAASLPNADYLVGDFFALGTPDSPLVAQIPPSSLDIAYDYTFACAINPQDRPLWAATYARVLKPGALLIVLVFPIVDPERGGDGPPHMITLDDVSGLLAPHGFAVVYSEPVAPEVTGPDSWRAGKEVMTVWKLEA